jgi:hypothetical protein
VYARVGITYLLSGGLMIDDGTDAGDGQGANSFYRVFLRQTALGGVMQAVEEYRSGGAAVTTNVGPTVPYGQFLGLAMRGTPFTTYTAHWWGLVPDTFHEPQSMVQFTTGAAFAPNAFVPTRIGLYADYTIVDHGSAALFDWWHEGNCWG